jgi:uncharacterized repeat protein (TIGR03803 family)
MTNIKINRCIRAFTVSLALTVALLASVAQAQTYTNVYNFTNGVSGTGDFNTGLLAQGRNGNIYGTLQGGPGANGTVFTYSLNSEALTLLYKFTNAKADGSGPVAGLTLGLDGNFYGATYQRSGSGEGEIFKITPDGVLTILYGFQNGADGCCPVAPPVQHPDGNLYGVTGNIPGTIYRITPNGSFTAIATPPSSRPQAPLIVGTDGNLYGTSIDGGGYAFQVTTKGKVKVLHHFLGGADGSSPYGALMQAADGKLYGITRFASASGQGGVIYQVTTGGAFKTLYTLAEATDGSQSYAGLVQGSDGFLYGVTTSGGANNLGTFFKVSTSGAGFTVLHNFDKATGATPYATPMLHTNGIIYGETSAGGTDTGVLYSMDAGLKPFASLFVIWSGKVGTQVGILGQGFNGTTGVKFGSGTGTFQVVSDNYMVATVPAGATTNKVTVLEPGGNLSSPQTFKVIPSATGFSPSSGSVGTPVNITGMSLTQTTTVTFGGVKATSFTVNSDTSVTALVPTGAKTGKIAVKTKGGSATAPGVFTVN